MEEHTLKLTNVHTQLLLQMQNEMNFQMMNERLIASQCELKTTQATLHETCNELKTTNDELHAVKVKLEQTQIELKFANAEALGKENQIAFLQNNIQKQIEQVQKQNEIGFIGFQQVTETFANSFSKTIDQLETPKLCFNFLENKENFQHKFGPSKAIEPFNTNGIKLEFPSFNLFVEKLNEPFTMNYENNFNESLKKMENGKIYNIDNNQLIFKLYLPKNYVNFIISHRVDIAHFKKSYANNTITHNDHLVVLDKQHDRNDYEIYLHIPNYNNNSKAYMYPKNETGDKLLLKYGAWNDNVNIDAFKNGSNEVLFMITKQ